MKSQFEGIFKTFNPAHDKYLARLFGLFSEDVVLNWCACPEASYENLGRPTLWVSNMTYLKRPPSTVRVGTSSGGRDGLGVHFG